MIVYPRTAARVDNIVRLNRNFYDEATLFDPYTIEKIEIWQNRFDPEFETKYPGQLLKDIRYGSRINYYDVINPCLDTLGLTALLQPTDAIDVFEFEYPFTNSNNVTISHNLNDRFPVVTVYDSTGVIIIPDMVQSIDVNTTHVTFGTAISGLIDILGANESLVPAPTTSVLVKRYIQAFSNALSVIVTHNLDDDSPLIYVYDSTFKQIFYSNVQVIDSNTVGITFGSPQTGQAIIMGGFHGNTQVGFGCQATARGTSSYPFDIHTGENDHLLIKVGTTGTDQFITLPQKFNSQVSDIITQINSQLVGAKVYVNDNDPTKIMIKSNEYGRNAYLELKPQADSAYNTLGLQIGTFRGLGTAPAISTGTKNGTYTITLTDNTLVLNFGAVGFKTVVLATGKLTATTVVSQINYQLNIAYGTFGTAYAEVTANREVKLKAIGGSIEIALTPNDAYDNIGFAVGTYLTDVISTIAETFAITTNNNNLKFIVNYNYTPVSLLLVLGNRTANQIRDEINAAIAAIALTDIVVAETTIGTAGGRIIIRALVNDGILRTGQGQYYTDYEVPRTFLSNGIIYNKFLDVWDYAPTIGYSATIFDDTDSFIVYADNYFLDSGYGDYSFSFSIRNDSFLIGERKYLTCEITALPKYKTPLINDWILPVCGTQYRITSQSDIEVVPWTNVDVNTGKVLKAMIDTNTPIWRDGVYKIYFKLSLPESSIIISSAQKFRVAAR